MKDRYEMLESIRTLVESDELSMAIELIYSFFPQQSCSIRNEISAMKGRLSRLERELRIGSLKYEDISSEKTRIALAILSITDEIGKQLTDFVLQ